MGHTSSSEGRRNIHCCGGSPKAKPDRIQDTVKVDLAPSPEKGRYGCFHPCSVATERHDTAHGPSPARPIEVNEILPCPSVVVTNVSSTSATILWSCSSAVDIQKMHIEVLVGSSDPSRFQDTRSVALFVLDGALESFVIPDGTLRRAHGPYCVKAVADAGSTEAPRLSNAGISAAFFTEPSPPGAVLGLRSMTSNSGGELELEWEPPDDDGGSRIHEYEVTLCAEGGTSRSFCTQECCIHLPAAGAEPSQPLRVEVRARSVGGVLGREACFELLGETAGAAVSVSPPPAATAPRSSSLDELVAQSATEASSSWLGAGWERAFVVEASAAFEPNGEQRSTMVRVRPGDSIQVLEQHSTGWTYCKNLSLEPDASPNGGPDVSGWVPDWVVKAKKARNSSKPKSKARLQSLGGAQGAATAA